MQERITNGDDILVEDLRIFNTFGWLMTDFQNTHHRSWLEACFKKADGAGSSGALAKSSGSASSSSGKAALKKTKLAIDSTKNLREATLSLFKKKTQELNCLSFVHEYFPLCVGVGIHPNRYAWGIATFAWTMDVYLRVHFAGKR